MFAFWENPIAPKLTQDIHQILSKTLSLANRQTTRIMDSSDWSSAEWPGQPCSLCLHSMLLLLLLSGSMSTGRGKCHRSCGYCFNKLTWSLNHDIILFNGLICYFYDGLCPTKTTMEVTADKDVLHSFNSFTGSNFTSIAITVYSKNHVLHASSRFLTCIKTIDF